MSTSRIVAVYSETFVTTHHESCRHIMDICIDAVVTIVVLWQDLVVRLCFVLGNLTRRDDTARSMLYFTCCCMEPLLHVFEVYIKLDEEVCIRVT